MTSLTGRPGAPRTWRRLPRRTARLRLTLLYGSLFTVCGAGLLGFTFWLFYRATAGKRLVHWEPATDKLSCPVGAQASHPRRAVTCIPTSWPSA